VSASSPVPRRKTPVSSSTPAWRRSSDACQRSAAAALRVAAALDADPRTTVVLDPEVDIVCVLPAGVSAAAASTAAERAFDTLADAGWHVAKLRVRTDWLRARHPEVERDAETMTVLRCCLLKQEHAAVADELAAALAEHLDAARVFVNGGH